MSMTQSLEQLRALQQVDLRIQILGRELVTLPEELNAVQADLAAVRKKHDDAKAALDAILKARRDVEAEIAACDSAVLKFETEKTRVKTNEEFRALNNQIEHQKTKKSELEDKVLESYEAEEKAADVVKKLKGEVDLVASRVSAKEKELAERGAADKAEVSRLEAERNEMAPALDAQMLRRYERLEASKGGLAVVTVIRGACGGCRTTLPPQVVAEVRRMDKLIECEHCARLLVWDHAEATAS